MMSERKNILVAGANGTTGRIIIDLLINSEVYQPIAMVKKQEQKDHFEKNNVSTIVADLEEDLSHAVKNADKVIFAAGSNGKNVIDVDQEGAKRMIDAAKKAGVNKFVMLSSMGASTPSANKDMEAYMQAKQNADKHLKVSGLNYCIVRPGALTDDDETGKIELKEKLDKRGSISRADVAKTLVAALKDDAKQHQTFQILSGEVPIEQAVQQK
jgi:uncharacterized protein YbjT (DUF2867 family)